MINSAADLEKEFVKLLKKVKGNPTAEFPAIAEIAFEAVVCAKTINEYAKIYGTPRSIVNPVKFLNQKPGKFNPNKAFKVEFYKSTFYFVTDVVCYGLSALTQKKPCGDFFEADVVVIEDKHIAEVLNTFNGRPAPQHLNAAYECKFGSYHKSHLRELLGFRRHISFLNTPSINNHPNGFPYGLAIANSQPDIQVILFRPVKGLTFFQPDTATLYDLHQQVL